MARFGAIGVNGVIATMSQEQKSVIENAWLAIHTAKENWKANR